MEIFWPIVILWIVLTVLGSLRKNARTRASVSRPAQDAPAERGQQRPAQGGFLEEMRRSLEQMQRAAEEQERKRRAAPGQGPAMGQDPQAWLEARHREARARQDAARARPPQPAMRKPVVRPVRPLEDDDAGKSSEDATVTSLEGTDYDDEAERVVAERAKAADRGTRRDASVEEMTPAQAARRGSRAVTSIGTVTEHAAWHQEIGAAPVPAAARPRAGRLARWADGTVRGALVLSEILGRAPGAR